MRGVIFEGIASQFTDVMVGAGRANIIANQTGSTHNGLAFALQNGCLVFPLFNKRRRLGLVCKRLVDIVISCLALLALLPLFVVIAILVKVSSSGPVLFRQKRVGHLGEEFSILKFRSMWQANCDPSGQLQASINDERMTKVGRMLRRTNLDELPQLWNVLVGEMSLVGPRPHVSGQLAAGMLYKEAVRYYDQRLHMKPGITGWAQANGLRGPTINFGLAKSRIDHDLAYIQNFSLWLDVKIVLRTIYCEMFRCTGY